MVGGDLEDSLVMKLVVQCHQDSSILVYVWYLS